MNANQTVVDDNMANLEAEVKKLREQNSALVDDLAKTKIRSVKVYEENNALKSNELVASKQKEMEYFLQMAKNFIQSGAFNAKNEYEAYVKIQAGQEMGLTPIESMNALYVVNGSINPYGKFMVARLGQHGYRVTYEDETDSGVTVHVTGPDNFEAKEVVKATDQILQRSKAMGFAKKNKMRFHGVRMIINFHLAHLFGSLSDLFQEPYTEYEELQSKSPDERIEESTREKQRQRIIDWIDTCVEYKKLEQIKNSVQGDDELEKLYQEKEEEIENYELCLTELLSEVEKIRDIDTANGFKDWIETYDHVFNSREIAMQQLTARAKELNIYFNEQSNQYEDIESEG